QRDYSLTASSSMPAMSEKALSSELPSVEAPAVMARAIRAAIRPYSMAVAPDSSLAKRAKSLVMMSSLLHMVHSTTVNILGCVDRMGGTYAGAVANGLTNRINGLLPAAAAGFGKSRDTGIRGFCAWRAVRGLNRSL